MLGVSASMLNRILKVKRGVSSEMALRLSKALGRFPESWTIMIFDMLGKQLTLMVLKGLNSELHNWPLSRVTASA